MLSCSSRPFSIFFRNVVRSLIGACRRWRGPLPCCYRARRRHWTRRKSYWPTRCKRFKQLRTRGYYKRIVMVRSGCCCATAHALTAERSRRRPQLRCSQWAVRLGAPRRYLRAHSLCAPTAAIVGPQRWSRGGGSAGRRVVHDSAVAGARVGGVPREQCRCAVAPCTHGAECTPTAVCASGTRLARRCRTCTVANRPTPRAPC